MSRTWRAVPLLCAALLARLVREGLLLRALVWPGLLSAVSLVGTALVVGVLRGAPTVAVADEALAPRLERGGFEPHVVADPLAEFESGRVGKALVPTEKGLRLVTRTTSQDLRNIESIARDAIGAQWRITIEPTPPPADLRMPTRMVAALVAILFTLYGVVLGAAVLYRDRQEGVIEAELSLPLPVWTHAFARLVATCLGLVVAYVTTLALLDGLLGIYQLGPWLLQGTAATITGAALGLGAMALGRGDSFSTPLSKALVASMALLFAGNSGASFGAWTPIASMGTLLVGGMPGVAPLAFSLVAGGLATFVFHRRGFQG
jgi:hypothetical protein